MAINQQLRAARKRKHWTQEQAGKACGVDAQTFFRWESRKQEPHGHNLKQLCLAFNLSMEELGYNPEGQTPEGAQSTLIYLTAEQIALLQPLLGGEAMDQQKRNTLRSMLTAAGAAVITPLALVDGEHWERLFATKPAAINQSTIQHFDSLLSTARALSNGSELRVANNLLDTFLPRLQEVAPHQAEVAGLTSQALLLKSILAAHDLRVSDKIALCQAAVEQAKRSTDPNLIVAGLLQLGVAYHYAQQQDSALRVQQEALFYMNQVSPLVQSHTYAELAATLAQFRRVREAEFYINLAYEVFPQIPEQDPNFAIDDHWFCNLGLYKGIMYTNLKRPKDAWEAFEEHRKIANIPERIRLEILNHQGRSAIQLGDLEKYTRCLDDGLSGSVALRSHKRYDEAIIIFQETPASWRKEPQLQPLREQYTL